MHTDPRWPRLREGRAFMVTNMKLEGYLSKISDTTKKLGVGAYAFRGQGQCTLASSFRRVEKVEKASRGRDTK